MFSTPVGAEAGTSSKLAFESEHNAAEARVTVGAPDALTRLISTQFEFHAADAVQGVHQASIVADLALDMEGYDPAGYFQHFSFQGYDHLLLARDDYGRCQALLGTTLAFYGGELCLTLVTGFVVNGAQGRGLMLRMIARTMTELSALGSLPGVIAARTYNPVWYRMLGGMGAALPGSTFYPRPAPAMQDRDMALLASEVVANTNPGVRFDAELGVLRDGLAKTPTLFRHQRPRCGTTEIDEFFHGQLGAIDLVLTLLDIRRVLPDHRRAWLCSMAR